MSIVMHCLDEVECLPHCIANAHDALARIKAQYGFGGEVVIADNGSTMVARHSRGARRAVVPVVPRGYAPPSSADAKVRLVDIC